MFLLADSVLPMMTMTFASIIAACWAWDSAKLHRQLDKLQGEVNAIQAGGQAKQAPAATQT